jgi:hypothetical protein
MPSPLLKKLQTKPMPRWLLSSSTIVARLNRKEIGDDDAKVTANILISHFKGQIVIDGFGAYLMRYLPRPRERFF